MNTITKHPMWPTLRKYIRIDHVGDSEHGRTRMEIRGSFPLYLQDMHTPCVYCGADIHPVRRRKGKSKRGTETVGAHYLAVTCDLHTSMSCCRSGEARDEFARIVNDIES